MLVGLVVGLVEAGLVGHFGLLGVVEERVGLLAEAEPVEQVVLVVPVELALALEELGQLVGRLVRARLAAVLFGQAEQVERAVEWDAQSLHQLD